MMNLPARHLACGILALGAWGCAPPLVEGGDPSSGGSNGSGGGFSSSGGAPSSGSGGTGGPKSSGGASGSGGFVPGGGGSTGNGSGGSSNGSGGAPSGNGGASVVACTITPTVTMSTKIATVAIVTWKTTQPNVKEAHIDFGLTTAYGMTAPVDLAEKDYRTLLLGMKTSKPYHYRVVSKDDAGRECSGADGTLMTGALANGLAKIKITTMNQSKLAGGFLTLGQYVSNAGVTGAPAYILDADGEYVWWYAPGGDVTGARMSHDGKHMWINSANVPKGTTRVHRVSMDGMTDENLSTEFSGQNHQITVLPDGTVAFYAYSSGACDDIKERAPDGTVKTIVNAGTAQGASGACHINTIQYSRADDTLVFSDLDHQTVTKVTRDGKMVWVLNSSSSQFKGDTWKGGQHGVHVLGIDSLLIFNNNSSGMSGGANNGSIVYEVKLDLTAKTVTLPWMYKATPGIQNDIMGDIQRLPNGNTVVGYSTQGVLNEVDATGSVLQQLSWPAGATFGYIEKRPTLYGPPVK
ncbi:MAG: aryl-sulfate sulfotransferase [Myxococcales bacterium]